ncbi:MAG TPA: CHAT domain-containing protein, partial [Humibacillus sp.]|nr:CHAT domain-containing protein [Humibacillus sp.]
VAARVGGVKDYGRRLGDALLTGPVLDAFTQSLDAAAALDKDLRVRLRLDAVPELDPVPWEYVYDSRLERFLTLSQQTPVVRLLDSLKRPPAVSVESPLRVLVMISSPSDMPELAVDREKQLLLATTADMVGSGQLAVTVLDTATLTELQRALLGDYHVFHFIGHGGFDDAAQEGVLVLEKDDGTSHRVSGNRLGTLLHDARNMQLAVLNACEGARTSGRDAFSGVGQALVRQGLPAVVAMQTEISDRAALVFSHEFYWFLTQGLGIDAAMCEVRKAMAVSDEASEWGTAVLLRSGTDQPFTFTSTPPAAVSPDTRLQSLYDAAQVAIGAGASETAQPLLEQITAESPDFRDATALLERVRPQVDSAAAAATTATTSTSTSDSTTASTTTPTMTDLTPVGAPDTHEDRSHLPPPPPPPPQGTTERARPGGIRRVLIWVGAVVGVLVIAFAGFTWWYATSSSVAKACGSDSSFPAVPEGAVTLGCATTAPTIDGSFADWAGVPERPLATLVAPSPPQPAPDDLQARWQGQWDSRFLYLHLTVDDAQRRPVDPTKPTQFWQGDGVSFEFGPDVSTLPPATKPRSGKDFHIMVGVTPGGGLASFNMANAGAIRDGGRLTDVVLSRTDRPGGYEVEMAVPWTDLGLVTPPVRGSLWAMNVNASDAVNSSTTWKLGRMISTNPVRTGNGRPAIWQPLVLGDAAGS